MTNKLLLGLILAAVAIAMYASVFIKISTQ
jgi:hypothetical protein